jgi:hypothetical protein
MEFKMLVNLQLPAKKIIEQNTGRFTFSDQNGNYQFLFWTPEIFIVSPQSVNWFSPVPSTHSAIFTGIQPNRFPQRFRISNRKVHLKMYV